MNTKLLGRWGEEQAAAFLRKAGYEILGLGYRTRYGEIDIIAGKNGQIAFVEVKLRRNAYYAEARENVTRAKQEKLKMTAQLWLQKEDCDLPCRFDVVEVYAPEGTETKKPEIKHLEDAFS